MTATPSHNHAPWSHRLLIALAALIAIFPLIHHGPSCGHDFDFHLLSWMEVANQFAHGNLHPSWAYTPAFNAGEPRFVFYPPISWTLGALLALLLTHLPRLTEAAAWTATPILFTWIALTLSGLTMHRLARSFVTANAALLAATIYIANPYMLFTAYERTAYAELLAAAWIPLLLHAILRKHVTIPSIAVPLALLWLTNAPAAVMGTYTLALLATLRIATIARATNAGAPEAGFASESWTLRHKVRLELARQTAIGTALGLSLAAFYIVPAAYERRFVQIAMATISGMRIDQNFLFGHTGTTPDALLHDQVLHTASTIALILLITTALALAALAITRKNAVILSEAKDPDEDNLTITSRIFIPQTFPAIPMAILASVIAFALTPPSLPLWNHLPQLTFLQFSWRLLAILAPVAALAIAALLNRLPLKPTPTAALMILLAITLTHPAYRIFHQPCDPEDTPAARLALFHSNLGTDSTDEYTPTSADNDSLTPNNPPYWLSANPDAPAPTTNRPGPAPTHLTLIVLHPEDLILNLRDYPHWRITLNHAPATTRFSRPDGLIALPIPAGLSTLDIRFTQSPDQTIGEAITLLALALFAFTTIRTPPHRTKPMSF